MAYRLEKNPETGHPEIVIDGWEKGIADSPYEGLSSLKNLNIRYLPGAVYSNYKRQANYTGTIGVLTYWTYNPFTGYYYAIDGGGKVWQTSAISSSWSQLTGNGAHLGGGQGIVVFKKFLFVFKSSAIDYYDIGAATWHFDWQTGLQSTNGLNVCNHMSIWGQDDIMYFCNGNKVGSLQEVVGMTFDPSDPGTYVYNDSALQLPSYETSTWLTELRVNLLISGGKRIYPWDRTSTNFNDIPLFIKETIYKMINIMNIIYVAAGVKGNIYVSNGYSISPFIKLPNSFFDYNIDPTIWWGDLMAHRNKLYMGASQVVPSGGISGIFSVDLDTKVINFENQNSFGLTVPSTPGYPGSVPNILIDYDDASIDTYVSGWYNGTNGGFDINSSTIYSSGETIIETDLIPVGTYLHPHTFENIEFKLDEPMQSGDNITIYGRSTLSESYTQIGTTTGVALSDVYNPMTFQKSQWIQFKIVLTYANTPTISIRLKEIRLR